MTRIETDFPARHRVEQQWMLADSWCAVCGVADVGMREVREFVEDGLVFVEGPCRRSGALVRAEVLDLERESDGGGDAGMPAAGSEDPHAGHRREGGPSRAAEAENPRRDHER
ncbi:MAG: hypothetical protein IT458_07690 [Planctomycetes bacterium]|nr:hypothetical protein [Planctomycetota bacterium]